MNRIMLSLAVLSLTVGCIVQPPAPAPTQPQPQLQPQPVDPFFLPSAPSFPSVPGGSGQQPDCIDGTCPFGATDSTASQALTSAPLSATADTGPPIQSAAAREKKTGAFKCGVCGKATVGDQFADLWAGKVSLHCMCKHCYATSSPAHRQRVIGEYLSRSGVDQSRPDIAAAVTSIVNQ